MNQKFIDEEIEKEFSLEKNEEYVASLALKCNKYNIEDTQRKFAKEILKDKIIKIDEVLKYKINDIHKHITHDICIEPRYLIDAIGFNYIEIADPALSYIIYRKIKSFFTPFLKNEERKETFSNKLNQLSQSLKPQIKEYNINFWIEWIDSIMVEYDKIIIDIKKDFVGKHTKDLSEQQLENIMNL